MITIIAAIGANNELAQDDKMLWSLPDDYARFKNITRNHPVIMGRKSVETLPDLLAERTAFVVTRDENYSRGRTRVVHSIEEAVEKACAMDEQVFIIGGGQIYHLGLRFAHRLELTRVQAKFSQANVFFPVFSTNEWELVASLVHEKDDNHAFRFVYETWNRKA